MSRMTPEQMAEKFVSDIFSPGNQEDAKNKLAVAAAELLKQDRAAQSAKVEFQMPTMEEVTAIYKRVLDHPVDINTRLHDLVLHFLRLQADALAKSEQAIREDQAKRCATAWERKAWSEGRGVHQVDYDAILTSAAPEPPKKVWCVHITCENNEWICHSKNSGGPTLANHWIVGREWAACPICGRPRPKENK